MDPLTMFAFAQGINTFSQQIGADKRQKLQIEAQRQLQREQNEWSEKMWNLNNEYNSPSNQLSLFQDAGLNPVFFMSGYNASSSSPAASTSMSVPSYAPAPEYGSPIDNYTKLYSQALQEKQLEIADKQLQVNQAKAEADIKKTAAETSAINISNEYARELNEGELRKLSATIRNINVSSGNIIQDTKLKAITAKLQAEHVKTEQVMRDINARNVVYDTMVKQAQVKLSEAQVNVLAEQLTGFILDNGRKAIELDIDGNRLRISQNEKEASGISLDILKLNKEQLSNMMESDEYKFSVEHPITTGVISGVVNTIGNLGAAFVAAKTFKSVPASTPGNVVGSTSMPVYE